ncbi:MAG TPA: hypothetical protein VJ553_04140 [Candidatus Paceibacterota bacterium]|nr:hypothetical protein [Candidatus Paceibacterota bacterium]
MRVDLKKLLAKARTHVMTEEEQEAQQRSFAYGNAALSNPNVTREMVDRAAEKRKNEKGVK